jgi:hypothetical protein
METFFAEGTLTQEQLVVRPADGDDGRQAVPAGLHVRASHDRRSSRCSMRS